MDEAVTDGVRWGLRRLFKHRESDTITEHELCETDAHEKVAEYVMISICERFDFPEPGGGNGDIQEDDPPPARGRHAG